MRRTWKSQVSSVVGAVGLSAILVMYTRCSTVRGSSMQPTIHDGDILYAERYPFFEKRVHLGDLVLAEDPKDKETVIKRVAHLPGEQFFYARERITLHDHQYWLLGDNEPISRDSREFGYVPVSYHVFFLYCPHEHHLKTDFSFSSSK